MLCCFLIVHALARISNHFPVGQSTLTSRFHKYGKVVTDYEKTASDYTSFVVGSSHAGVIDDDVFPGAEKRWSQAGQDIFEGRYIIENSVPTASNLEKIFVSISYFTFVYDNKVREDFRLKYYALPSLRPMKTDWHNFVIGKSLKYFPIISLARQDGWKNVWNGMKTEKGSDWIDYVWTLIITEPRSTSTNTHALTVDNMNRGLKEELTLLNDCRYMSYDAMVARTDKGVANLNSLAQTMSESHRNITTDTYKELEKIISTADVNDVEVIFFTPPYHPLYLQAMSKEIPFNIEGIESQRLSYIDLTKLLMNNAIEEYDIKYYDFSHDPEFANNQELFVNSSHLNNCGKRLFSVRLWEAVQQDTNL